MKSYIEVWRLESDRIPGSAERGREKMLFHVDKLHDSHNFTKGPYGRGNRDIQGLVFPACPEGPSLSWERSLQW